MSPEAQWNEFVNFRQWLWPVWRKKWKKIQFFFKKTSYFNSWHVSLVRSGRGCCVPLLVKKSVRCTTPPWSGKGAVKKIAPTATKIFFCGCWCNFFHRPLVREADQNHAWLILIMRAQPYKIMTHSCGNFWLGARSIHSNHDSLAAAVFHRNNFDLAEDRRDEGRLKADLCRVLMPFSNSLVSWKRFVQVSFVLGEQRSGVWPLVVQFWHSKDSSFNWRASLTDWCNARRIRGLVSAWQATAAYREHRHMGYERPWWTHDWTCS